MLNKDTQANLSKLSLRLAKKAQTHNKLGQLIGVSWAGVEDVKQASREPG